MPALRDRLLPLAAALAITAPVAARATEAVYPFNIPPGRLTDAVNALALQSGRQAMVPPILTAGRQTAGLTGRYTLPQALDRLLSGAGLTYRILADRMILIVPNKPPPAAHAALAAPSAVAAAAAEMTPIDTLIVTAGVDEAPPNAERLTTRALVRNGVFDLRDAARLTPSVTAVPTGSGQMKLALRGVYGAGEATTPIYFGDLPISGASGTTSDPGLVTPDLALVDIDHVDILRGPQGVERGAGAIGGELRIAPAEPVLGRTEATVQVQGGALENGAPNSLVYAVGNLPVGQDAAARIVVYRRHAAGYIENVRLGGKGANGAVTQGVRLALAAVLADGLEARGFALYQERTINDLGAWRLDLGPYRSDRYTLNAARHRIGAIGTTLRKQVGDITFTNTAGYYDWTLGRRIDSTEFMQGLASSPDGCRRYFDLDDNGTCSPDQVAGFGAYVAARTPSALVQSTGIQALVEEFRAEGGDAQARWTAGLFAERRAEHADSATMVIAPGTGQVVAAAGYTGLRTIDSRFEQVAVYGEAVRGVGERLTLTAGLRYAFTDRSASSDVLIPNLISGSTTSVPRRMLQGGRITTRLRADWHLDAGGLYVQASQGSRPGGVNTTPDPTQTRTRFSPDSLWNYEIGGEQSWFDKALTFEAAAFLIDVRDMQFGVNTPNGAFGYVTNIGEARIRGLESAVKATLGAGFHLEFNAAATDARLAGDDPGRVQLYGARAGDRIPNVPAYRHTLALEYRRTLADGALVTVAWQDEHRSAITSQFRWDDPLFLRSPAYTIDNLNGAWSRGPLTLQAAVTNLFGKQAVDFASSSSLSPRQAFSVPPRSWSLTVRRTW